MKFSVALLCCVSTSLFANLAMAGDDIPLQMREDAEYMMRKVVEDIHQFNVTSTVTDTTRDKGIQVVGHVLEFLPEVKDQQTGAMFSCAQVSLSTNIQNGKSNREQITRTDEICIDLTSGAVNYIPNIQ